MNRLLSEPSSARPWAPAVDIFETENELVLKADIPQVDLKDIDIRVENDTISIKGERKFTSEGGGYHRIERSYGSFSVPSACLIPWIPSTSGPITRTSVLTVTLPKKEVAKPRQVKIEVQQ